MHGRVEVGQRCTVEPVEAEHLNVGDVVLCEQNGQDYLMRIKAIQGDRFQIVDNRGAILGWIRAHSIFGRCVRVE